MAEPTIQQIFDAAAQHHKAGRLRQAEDIYRQLVTDQPENAEARNYLGNVLKDLGQVEQAIAAYRQAIMLRPNYAEAHGNLGNALKDSGQLEEAIAAYRQAIALRPNLAAAHNNLGIVLRRNGQLDDAIAAYRRAIALKPDYAEAHNNLGIALKYRGQIDDAIAAYRRAIALKATYAEAYSNLGNALKERGQLDEAIAACRQAVAVNPNFSEAYFNLSQALREKSQLAEAIAACRKAISLNPNSAEVYNVLGATLSDDGQLDEAVIAFRRAIALNPAFHEAYNNLASALKDQGKLDEAVGYFRKAIQLNPAGFQVGSNLIYMLYFHPDYDSKTLLKEHLEWARLHSEPLKQLIQPHANDRTVDRRLRVGYVSPDFRNHCQSFFTIPLLSNHDRTQFEIYCYSSVIAGDSVTERIRGYADQWRNVTGISDAGLAETVRHDKIDILIDLTMHMANGRPLLFARKPAPVQVAWLAYPGTTGISAIDYRLTDPFLDPPGANETDYTERTIRLADSFWCYDPLAEDPQPAPLPALARGRFTFGCLNNFCKINEPVLAIWAKVLAAVPNSDLLLLAPHGISRQPILDSLSGKGIDPSRVQFVATQPRADYLKTFQRIDLCLDTFPYNGHTTSLDSLWMGVPVLSLADGRSPVGRAGISILSNLEMKDLLARDHEQYVVIAADLAGDLSKLVHIRTSLRERMRRSPLMDGPRFARNIEAAYRQMWRALCESK